MICSILTLFLEILPATQAEDGVQAPFQKHKNEQEALDKRYLSHG